MFLELPYLLLFFFPALLFLLCHGLRLSLQGAVELVGNGRQVGRSEFPPAVLQGVFLRYRLVHLF